MDLFLLFGLLAMGATLYAVRFWDRRHAHPDWQRLPTRAEYLSTHPECTTDDEQGARCCACGSDKVLAPPRPADSTTAFAMPAWPAARRCIVPKTPVE
ncbi:hypothetical protein D3C72_469320 [compost metagenome]|uniref:hypothetical protein n=1 Tax=Aeromonas media TaxID=651 RepID=UPI000FBC180D|nr:hypothetical protein [Aeromonas media]